MTKIESFLEYLKLELNYSEKTINSYEQDILSFEKYLSTVGVGLEDANPQLIREYLSRQIEEGKTKVTCCRRIAALRHFYTYLVRKNVVKENPFLLVGAPKKEIRYPEALYLEQIELLFTKNRERTDELRFRDQAIVELLYASGVRVSELVNIKMNTIDLKNRIIKVLGKGRKERMVMFSKSCQDTLKEYLEKCHLVHSSDYLFVNAKGGQLTTRGVEYILDQIQDKTGVHLGLRPHMLRHTFATHLRRWCRFTGHPRITWTRVN